jgi:DNA-binding NarL/FixJ family response regulator
MRNEIKQCPGDVAEAADALPVHSCGKRESTQQVTRIVVVDDHDIVRTGLVVLLDREHDIKVVGAATTGEEAVQAARRLKPDLIIMDLVLPTLNGIDATRLIRREFPQMRVIALSASQKPGHVWRALSAGANGYVLKNAPSAEIVLAVKSVIAGGMFFSAAIATLTSGGFSTATAIQRPFDGLSAREREVLRRIAAGSTSADIAKCLSLSPKTVETYRGRLMVKLQVANRAALIRLALDWELPAV